jgi:hypothetical protein
MALNIVDPLWYVVFNSDISLKLTPFEAMTQMICTKPWTTDWVCLQAVLKQQ